MRFVQFFIYLISSLRIKLFQAKILKTYTFDVPIISIGNIAMGGAGKTPMTDWLVKYLISIDKKPCIITRGYGRINKKTVVVNPSEEKSYSVDDLGDEPFSLWKKYPEAAMVVGNNKIKSINVATKAIDFDVIILDDGFQSLYINRNLDIVMIGAQKANTLMREKPKSLKRADVVVFKNLADDERLDGGILSTIKQAGALKLTAENIVSLGVGGNFEGPFFALCGIADPSSFMDSLVVLDISVNGVLHYRDHYNYSTVDMKNIIQKMRACNARTIITTSKDYYKLDKINKYDIKIVVVDFSIDFVDNKINNNKSELVDRINETIK